MVSSEYWPENSVVGKKCPKRMTKRMANMAREKKLNEMTLNEYVQNVDYEFSGPIVYPKDDLKFNIKQSIFKILPAFKGEENEEPYEHLYDFILICKSNGLSQDGLRLRLFTLKGSARKWYRYLPPKSIFSWADVQKAFMTSFYIRPSLINFLPNFYGEVDEEPYDHIDDFNSICDTNHASGLTQDGLRLRLFPSSLKGKAKKWFAYFPEPKSIASWKDMRNAFLKEFYPMERTIAVQSQIRSFQQKPGERLCESLQRFRTLLFLCQHHGIAEMDLLTSFYYG